MQLVRKTIIKNTPRLYVIFLLLLIGEMLGLIIKLLLKQQVLATILRLFSYKMLDMNEINISYNSYNFDILSIF